MVRNVDTIGGGKVPCYFAGRPYSRCSSQNPDDGHCDPLSACPRMCSLVTAMLIRSSSSWWIISSASLIFCVYLEDIVIISKSHAEHLRSPTNFFYLTLQYTVLTVLGQPSDQRNQVRIFLAVGGVFGPQSHCKWRGGAWFRSVYHLPASSSCSVSWCFSTLTVFSLKGNF